MVHRSLFINSIRRVGSIGDFADIPAADKTCSTIGVCSERSNTYLLLTPLSDSRRHRCAVRRRSSRQARRVIDVNRTPSMTT
eukprot:scaffold117464_cov17-Prasinocladus_malaysianus.AAC.1